MVADTLNKLYGMAFFLIAIAPYGPIIGGRAWIQNVATGIYAAAASSGSVYFSLNFGAEGDAPMSVWVWRACVVQGTQQAYLIVLWYWGSRLASLSAAGNKELGLILPAPWAMTVVGTILGAASWVIATVVWLGLPDHYRHPPSKVPSFYSTTFRRKIVLVGKFGFYPPPPSPCSILSAAYAFSVSQND